MQDEIESCINSLAEKFLKWPYHFFTESDAHSFLYYYIFRSGPKTLKQSYPTLDPTIKTTLIHREYPTSFRYLKDNMKLADKGGRGHYDLVILNPDFMIKHSIDEIIAKDYKKCCVDEKNHLQAAIEFKFITSPLSKNMREEIQKDFIKLSWAVEKEQATHAYMIIFNRARTEKAFYDELDISSKNNPLVKGLYVESVKRQRRDYKVIYLNNWSQTLVRYVK